MKSLPGGCSEKPVLRNTAARLGASTKTDNSLHRAERVTIFIRGIKAESYRYRSLVPISCPDSKEFPSVAAKPISFRTPRAIHPLQLGVQSSFPPTLSSSSLFFFLALFAHPLLHRVYTLIAIRGRS